MVPVALVYNSRTAAAASLASDLAIRTNLARTFQAHGVPQLRDGLGLRLSESERMPQEAKEPSLFRLGRPDLADPA